VTATPTPVKEENFLCQRGREGGDLMYLKLDGSPVGGETLGFEDGAEN